MTQAGSSSKADKPIGCHEMRITEHTKLRRFVAFGLKFLQENPDRPLVLHTLPPKERQTADRDTFEHHNDASNDTSPDERLSKKIKIPRPTHAITQLISVVEIIKREYAAWDLARKGAGGRRPAESALRTGLHQYNELSTLESLGIILTEEEEVDEAEKLGEVLRGRNSLGRKQWPHPRVTLSVNALPQLQDKGVTYQPPVPLCLSRFARKREQRGKNKKTQT